MNRIERLFFLLELTTRWERLQVEAKALDPRLLDAGPAAREARSR